MMEGTESLFKLIDMDNFSRIISVFKIKPRTTSNFEIEHLLSDKKANGYIGRCQ